MIYQYSLIFLSILPGLYALIHKLVIRDDDRNLFKIETFGFFPGGSMNITITDFHLTNVHPGNLVRRPKVGFLVRRAASESAAQQDIEGFLKRRECILDENNRHPDDVFIDLYPAASDVASTDGAEETLSSVLINRKIVGRVFPKSKAGLYSLVYANCYTSAGPSAAANRVNFHMHLTLQNPGPNYLSAGEIPLPHIYLLFCGLFAVALVMWIRVVHYSKNSSGSGTTDTTGNSPKSAVSVQAIHYLMTALVSIKVITLLFESIRFQAMAGNGMTVAGWNTVYYIFASIKGIMLFVVILLIGSGWSLLKNHLSVLQTRFIACVLVLQVINHIVMVVLDESAPGSQGWLTTRDILHIIDILCCCAILFPIVWSIQHLKQAASVDGKAKHSLKKLQTFQRYYVIVVLYVYITRIVIYLLEATLPFTYLWVGAFSTETVSLLFYGITGWMFRPAENSNGASYSKLPESDDVESGTDEDDFGVDEENSITSRRVSLPMTGMSTTTVPRSECLLEMSPTGNASEDATL